MPLLGAVFLTSASAILFEISLTKIFSVTLWYHFAYFVVSLALFGLGAGGLAVFFWRSFLSKRFPDILKDLAVVQFLAMTACLLLVLHIPSHYPLVFRLVLIYVVCAIPFALVGSILSLVILHYAENTPRIYFADLLGSGAGCIIFIVGISLVSGPAVALLAAFLALASSLLFTGLGQARRLALRAAGAALLAILLVCLATATGVFTVKYTKKYQERADLLFEKWSPLARITVYPAVFWRDDPANPFGWGMSPKFVAERPIEQYWIEQDASAGTPITRFTGDLEEVAFLKHDVTSFVYRVHPHPSEVFILGSGGGRDVLTALAFGVPSITACDINPVIVDLVRDRYREFAGGVYELPGVSVAVAEGRSYIRSVRDTFDIIQISLIDSWAATAAGAFSLAENNLYTTEAFASYLDHLKADGVLSVTRYLFMPRTQSLRAALLARHALEQAGVETPERNIAVVSTSDGQGVASVLVKRSAFTPSEIHRIQKEADELGFATLYVPGVGGDVEFSRALGTARPETYVRDAYYDLRPPTDDRPFFFQMVYFSRSFDLLRGEAIAGQTFNYYAPLILIALIALSAVLVAIFYVVPLALTRRAERLPAHWGVYFLLLGVGFMFVEIPLLQKGSLYLGHPTFSLSIVLFSMLTFAGLGSYWSGRIRLEALPRTLNGWIAACAALVVVAALGSGWLVRHTIGLPLAVRVVLFVLLVGVPAFLMGTAFPSGMRLVSGRHRHSIPWAWALNAGASVMGSVLAMAIAMAHGYTLTLALGALCYVGAFGAVLAHRRAVAKGI